MAITHATFTFERDYAVPVSRVFDAWASSESRQRWFADGAAYEQEFAVGGIERVRAGQDDGPDLIFELRYHDIVRDARIIYTSTLSSGEDLSTVSATTVEFTEVEDGTRLVLTEHGIYLPGQEQPAWRERGTTDQLAALATELETQEAS